MCSSSLLKRPFNNPIRRFFTSARADSITWSSVSSASDTALEIVESERSFPRKRSREIRKSVLYSAQACLGGLSPLKMGLLMIMLQAGSASSFSLSSRGLVLAVTQSRPRLSERARASSSRAFCTSAPPSLRVLSSLSRRSFSSTPSGNHARNTNCLMNESLKASSSATICSG